MNFKIYFKKIFIPDLEPGFHVILFILTITGVISAYIAWSNKESLSGNIAIESFSLIFTIFIIDRLNEIRSLRETKRKLIRQVGSTDNGMALNAISELDAHDWLHQNNIFKDAWLRKANLKDAVVWNVDFSESQLSEADFTNADLTNSKFRIVDLRLAIFDSAKLVGAYFKADLIGVSFKGSFLQEVVFDECRLIDIDFSNSILQGVNFKNCKAKRLNLKGAIYNSATKFPENINPKELGAQLVEESAPIINERYL